LLPQETFEGQGRKYRRPAAIYAQTPLAADRAAKLLKELGEDAPPGRHLSPRAAGGLLIDKRKERAEHQESVTTLAVKLYEGRFQEVGGKVKNGSVSLIWTDPPWNREWLPQWSTWVDSPSGRWRMAGSS
jgi:hypothetical protein